MKAHSIDQTAAWAKSWKIKGYEKNRQHAIKKNNERRRNHGHKTMEESR